VSATPAQFELGLSRWSPSRSSADGPARPRDHGAVDEGQVEDLIGEVRKAAAQGERCW